MKKFYYPAVRAHHAYCMAIDFGMQFVNSKGNYWSTEGLLHLSNAKYKIDIAEQSLPILSPQKGDIIFFDNGYGGEGWDEVVGFSDKLVLDSHCDIEASRVTRIIMRKGIPFHWPATEIVMDPLLEKAMT